MSSHLEGSIIFQETKEAYLTTIELKPEKQICVSSIESFGWQKIPKTYTIKLLNISTYIYLHYNSKAQNGHRTLHVVLCFGYKHGTRNKRRDNNRKNKHVIL